MCLLLTLADILWIKAMVLGKVLAMNYHSLEARSGPPRANNYTQKLISRGIIQGALHMCPPPIFEGIELRALWGPLLQFEPANMPAAMKRPAAAPKGKPLKKPSHAWHDDDDENDPEVNDNDDEKRVAVQDASGNDMTGCTRQQMHCWRKFKNDLPAEVLKKYEDMKVSNLPGHPKHNINCHHTFRQPHYNCYNDTGFIRASWADRD